jgi:hypothetical protein
VKAKPTTQKQENIKSKSANVRNRSAPASSSRKECSDGILNYFSAIKTTRDTVLSDPVAEKATPKSAASDLHQDTAADIFDTANQLQERISTASNHKAKDTSGQNDAASRQNDRKILSLGDTGSDRGDKTGDAKQQIPHISKPVESSSMEDDSTSNRTAATDRRPPASSRAERMMQSALASAPKRPDDSADPPSTRRAALEWLAEEQRRRRALDLSGAPAAIAVAAMPARKDREVPETDSTVVAAPPDAAPEAEKSSVPLQAGLRDLLRSGSDMRQHPLLPTRSKISCCVECWDTRTRGSPRRSVSDDARAAPAHRSCTDRAAPCAAHALILFTD